MPRRIFNQSYETTSGARRGYFDRHDQSVELVRYCAGSRNSRLVYAIRSGEWDAETEMYPNEHKMFFTFFQFEQVACGTILIPTFIEDGVGVDDLRAVLLEAQASMAYANPPLLDGPQMPVPDGFVGTLSILAPNGDRWEIATPCDCDGRFLVTPPHVGPTTG